MKESIGGTWLFIIVIAFVLLFTGIMCMTINQSRAFAVKSDIISFIENSEGDIYKNKTGKPLKKELVDIIKKAGYYTTGVCPEDYMAYDREGTKLSKGARGSICLKKVDSNLETGGCSYELVVFYELNLPAMESIFTFRINGKTKTMYKNCDKG